MKTALVLLLTLSWTGPSDGQSPSKANHDSQPHVTPFAPPGRPGQRAPQAPSPRGRSGTKPADHPPRARGFGNVVEVRPTGAGKSSGLAGGRGNPRPLLVRPPRREARSGQPFQEARARPSRPAIVTGSVNAATNTAVINGTTLKRKP